MDDQAMDAEALAKAGARHTRKEYELLRGIKDSATGIVTNAIALGADPDEVQEAMDEAIDDATEGKAIDERLLVKALGQNRVGGYLVLWGDAEHGDLTPIMRPGQPPEWFTPQTKGLTTFFDTVGKVPMLYHHGKDKTVGLTPVGVWDVMQPDDVGLWTEGQLDVSTKFRSAIKTLIDKRALGMSSQALGSSHDVAKSGEIRQWIIAEGTLTPTPCDYRMMERPVAEIKAAYKAVNLDFPDSETDDSQSAQGDEESRAREVAAGRAQLAILQMDVDLIDT